MTATVPVEGTVTPRDVARDAVRLATPEAVRPNGGVAVGMAREDADDRPTERRLVTRPVTVVAFPSPRPVAIVRVRAGHIVAAIQAVEETVVDRDGLPATPIPGVGLEAVLLVVRLPARPYYSEGPFT